MNAGTRPPIDAWVHLPPTELLATVQVHPAPDIPLASIRHLLRPLHDDDGRLVDWYLFASGFEERDAVAEYWQWRASWRRHWPIGSVAHIAWLHEVIADIDHDLDERSLDRLLEVVVASGGERRVHIPPGDAPALLAELATIRLALSVDDRHGWGIVDDMPSATRGTGLARTWIAPTHELLLAGTTTSAVVLRGDGRLAVLHPAEHNATEPHVAHDVPAHRFSPASPAHGVSSDTIGAVHLAAAGPGVAGPVDTFDGVTAADLRGDTVIVLNDRGSSLRLSQDAARPLGWLVPRSLRWHVRQIPLAAVWSNLFTGLVDALRHATDAGEPVVISGETGIA